MTVQRFDADDPRLARWMKSKIREGSIRGIYSTALRIVGVIVDEVIPNEKPPPVDQRHYASAWRAEPTTRGADVVNNMPYAAVIEHGARAQNIKVGKAMIDALTEWVKRKGLAGKSPRSGTGARENWEAESRNIAWAIAMSFKRKGIFNRDGEGLRIGAKGVKKGLRFLKEEVAREVNKARGLG